MKPKISQVRKTTGLTGGGYAGGIGGYSRDLKFGEQVIGLRIEPVGVARFPYNVSGIIRAKQRHKLSRAGMVKSEARWQLEEYWAQFVAQQLNLLQKC